jgi:DNA-binding MarR family transcriptional regulator
MRGENGRLRGEELDLWRAFTRAYASIQRGLESELEGGEGIPLRSFTVLLELDRAPGKRMRMSDLADAVTLSRSGLSRLIDRLVDEGSIERAECDDDARGSFAVLTEPGAERLRDSRPTHTEAVRRLFLNHFSTIELRSLSDYLERVRGE